MTSVGGYPEGGWGWVVAGSCFIVEFVVFGTLKSLGVLITHMKDDFGNDLWIFGSIVALHYGMQFVLTPVAASMARKLSCRVIVTFGGILYGTGLVLSALTYDVTIMAIGLVVVSGTGAACVIEITNAELAFYFHEKYPVAIFISLVGAPIGMMVYGPVTQVLMDTYGWRGAMLLLGGVGFNMVPAGMLTKKSKGLQATIHVPDTSRVTVDEDDQEGPDAYQDKQRSQMRRLWALVSSALGLDAVWNTDFMTLAGVRMLYSISYGGVVVYTVANGLSVGLSATESSFLTTLWGFGNLTGLCVTGFVLHKKLLSTHATAVLVSIVSAISLGLAPFIHTLSGQMVNTFILGVGVDSVVEVVSVMTRSLPFSDNSFFVVLGWQTFLGGASACIGDTVSGWLYDVTGTFQVTFLMYSAAMVAVIFLVFMDALHALKELPKYRNNMMVAMSSFFERGPGSYSAIQVQPH